MSRITQKSSVAPLNPWGLNSSTTSFSGTATPAVSYEAFSAIPDSGAQPATGTGFYYPGFQTYVGQKFDSADGREFVLVKNGTVALVAGVLVQSPQELSTNGYSTTAFEKLAMTVPTATPATAGSTQILVTNGGTVLNVNQFAGGYAIVAAGTGIGQMLKIASHAPAAASATFIVNLEDAIQTTLDATSKISLLANPYNDVVITPITTATGGPVGVTITPIAASTAATYNGTSGLLTANGVAQYGLIQTHGPTACLVDSTVTNVGYPLGVSKTTAGTVGVASLTTVPQIAVSMQTLTSAQVGLINLML